jgi:hypothetical protein
LPSRLGVIAWFALALAAFETLPAAAECVDAGLPDGRIATTVCGAWVNRIDMPHAWSGALVYLDAISLTRPELTPYRPWERVAIP